MLHHYGKILPKIYASPIQPRGKISHVGCDRTYLDFIRDDFDENVSTNTQSVNVPADSIDVVSQKGTFDKQTQTSTWENLNLRFQFTPEEDLRILDAVDTLNIKDGPNRLSKKNWNCIKMVSKLPQTSNQLKNRYKNLTKRKSRNYLQLLSDETSSKKAYVNQIQNQQYQYQLVPRVSNAEKIYRIAAAMKHTTQREYFDYSFFEKLPALIGTTESCEHIRRFYLENVDKIRDKLDNATAERFLLTRDFSLKERITFMIKYRSQRDYVNEIGKRRETSMSNVRNSSTVEFEASNILKKSKLAKKRLEFTKSISCSMSRSFVNPEWNELVEFISKEDVYPYLTEDQFWDCVKTNLKTQTQQDKLELMETFFAKIIPSRNDEIRIELPSFKLQPSSRESKILIFHEVNKSGILPESIQQLIEDELLSDELCAEKWFEVFATAISLNDKTFFISNDCEYQIVKETVRRTWLMELCCGTVLNYKKLYKLFQPDIATDYLKLCQSSKVLPPFEMNRQELSFYSVATTSSAELATKQDMYHSAIVIENPTTTQNYQLRYSHAPARQYVGQQPGSMLQKLLKFKNQPIPSWQVNLPTATTSAEEFGRLHVKKPLTDAEWIACLGVIKSKAMLPYMLRTDFWDNLRSCMNIKVFATKSADQLKEEFFTNVLPNRHAFPGHNIPRLKLRPSDAEALWTIFHEIRKSSCVTTSIETLVADEILSDMLDWEGWFHLFCQAVFQNLETIWMVPESDVRTVKELVVQYFFERVTPKLVVSNMHQYKRLIDDAINEIALDFKTY